MVKRTQNNLALVNISILIIMTFVMFIPPVAANDEVDWSNMNPLTVFKAISVFESNPASTDGASAMAIVMNFAQASPNVDVIIDSGFFPWLRRKPVVEKSDVLLAAFVAGNIRPQLEKQVKQDHPIDGLLSMCKIYTILRDKSLLDKIHELESWAKMDRDKIELLVPLISYMKRPQPARQVESEGLPSD